MIDEESKCYSRNNQKLNPEKKKTTIYYHTINSPHLVLTQALAQTCHSSQQFLTFYYTKSGVLTVKMTIKISKHILILCKGDLPLIPKKGLRAQIIHFMLEEQ
jgi:hypothetical protein